MYKEVVVLVEDTVVYLFKCDYAVIVTLRTSTVSRQSYTDQLSYYKFTLQSSLLDCTNLSQSRGVFNVKWSLPVQTN